MVSTKTEDRITRVEREIKARFARFNAAVEQGMAEFVTVEGIDEANVRATYRKLVSTFASEMAAVYLLGGALAAKEAESVLDKLISFDPSELRTQAALTELKNRVIQGLERQQAEALLEMHRANATIVPIRKPNQIRRGLSLTGRQTGAVQNYRRLLEVGSREALSRTLRDRRFDRTVVNSIENSTPLTIGQIDTMVERYQERQLARRAKTIAATEAVTIANQSDNDFYRQAINNQDVRADQLVRTWVDSRDGKVRDSHVYLNGKHVEFDEPWVTSNGNIMMYPGDPSAPAKEIIDCRCWVRTDIRT